MTPLPTTIIEVGDNGERFDEFFSALPEPAKKIWKDMEEADTTYGLDYAQLDEYQKRLAPHGVTFDYGMDATVFDIKLTLNKKK